MKWYEIGSKIFEIMGFILIGIVAFGVLLIPIIIIGAIYGENTTLGIGAGAFIALFIFGLVSVIRKNQMEKKEYEKRT